MLKTRAIGRRRNRIMRIAFLCALVHFPLTFAESVTLGGSFSVFDDLFIVATDEGDNTQNCTNLTAAIAAVSGIGTIKLTPGIYDCETTTLVIPSGVTLEGSGQQNSKIIGQVSSSTRLVSVVAVLGGAELYNLTVENTAIGTAKAAAAIQADPGSVLNHVTAISSGTGNVQNTGITLPGPAGATPTQLNHVVIRASGASLFSEGISSAEDNAILDGVDIQVTNTVGGSVVCGIYLSSGSPSMVVRHSVIKSDDIGIADGSGSSTIDLAHSLLVGTVTGSGAFSCLEVHDEDDLKLNGACGTSSTLSGGGTFVRGNSLRPHSLIVLGIPYIDRNVLNAPQVVSGNTKLSSLFQDINGTQTFQFASDITVDCVMLESYDNSTGDYELVLSGSKGINDSSDYESFGVHSFTGSVDTGSDKTVGRLKRDNGIVSRSDWTTSYENCVGIGQPGLNLDDGSSIYAGGNTLAEYTSCEGTAIAMPTCASFVTGGFNDNKLPVDRSMAGDIKFSD